ncbi:trimeric intracellular cation channel family protein [Roseiterribacter gracilis]|uniref:Membrane protein n=1 Tax=Roseiterribacter gracilis TaxID=2812848 RepID=A0A8S8XH58_9PROT|nr:membrane protein [Rhodospirillales bacterium TMPK1]
MIEALAWIGLVAFAISGATAAAQARLDVVGFALVAVVTGFGGGTLRDLVLGVRPVNWVEHPAGLWLCALTGIVCFIFERGLQHRRLNQLLPWADALGLGAFAVIGTEIALRTGAGPFISILMGVATATIGGLARDVLCNQVPMVLRKEIYALAAALGATTFVVMLEVGMPQEVAAIIGFAAGLTLRAAAIALRLSLPTARAR